MRIEQKKEELRFRIRRGLLMGFVLFSGFLIAAAAFLFLGPDWRQVFMDVPPGGPALIATAGFLIHGLFGLGFMLLALWVGGMTLLGSYGLYRDYKALQGGE